MEQLSLTANTKDSLARILIGQFDILISEYPRLAEEISTRAAAIEEKKSLSLKGLQSAFKKSGLIGKGGVFSLLTKALLKKPSATSISPTGLENKETGLTPDAISALPAVTPLSQTPVDATKKKEQDFLQETQKAIPVEFAGFTYEGEADFKRVMPPLFEDILKKFFKKTDQFDTGGLMPETDTDYGGGLLETLANLAILRGGMKGAAGRPRGRIRQFFRNRKAGHLRAQRTAARAAKAGTPPPLPASKPVSTTTPPKTTPPVKPSKPVTTAPTTAGKAATKAVGKGAATSVGKAAAKRIPLLGTALTVGFLGSELLETSKQEQAGEITKEEAKKQKAGAVGGAGGGLAGALGGAAAGAAIGTLIPIPVVGTVVGGLVGGIVGGMGGEMLGRTAGEALVGDEAPALAQPESQPPVVIPTPEAAETPEINIPKPIDNTNILNTIATNTGSTNEVLKALSQAIFKLAQTYETKGSKDSSNIFINGQQQNPTPSASQVAAQNVDPIRQVRMQFAV